MHAHEAGYYGESGCQSRFADYGPVGAGLDALELHTGGHGDWRGPMAAD